MDRLHQLEYCKICQHRKFDSQQGIICKLTAAKADFEESCDRFEIDQANIEKQKQRATGEHKERLSFGFSPRQTDSVLYGDLTPEQAYVLAWETVQKLGWETGYSSASGFVAYTGFSLASWSEEVQVKVGIARIDLKSECTGNQPFDWGKNRRNIEDFRKTFEKLHRSFDVEMLAEKYNELSVQFAADIDQLDHPPLIKKGKITSVFSLFVPQKGYFVTPIIVMLNVLVFLLMIAFGVSPLLPDGEQLLHWGANFRPYTLDGQGWRLITHLFVHIGVFHLLMNMYALVYIGLLLEPYLGKTRLAFAYLLSGIVGGATSVFWHEFEVSAGASGAIFGLYGVFLAMLTTNLMEKSARKSLLISIGVFVFYNLANGMKAGIDNAAHIGGLVSGLLIGYAYYPELKTPNLKLKYATMGALLLVASAGSLVLMRNSIERDFAHYQADMQKFARMEEEALGLYRMQPNSSDEQILAEIENNGIKNWEASIALLDSVDHYELPSGLHDHIHKLRLYCDLRLKSYGAISRAISEKTRKYDTAIMNYNAAIEDILREMGATQDEN
ncbi:rhomboid family intramembrane serine protease [Mangrovibacterium diazotrophicum]|uniref:Rhomboid protease GluP n=1 Tax=Mangrovibacterium diazotrophicum TaxID=1261403 RepID=A0A419WBR7_9BACT|nr:rhomboid family intramembrane serine protease [Mangrovibacterium diazotrophicum]RKD92862.1 rhomboid protease GluP [Mangrovibacterium diazotrophicum]